MYSSVSAQSCWRCLAINLRETLKQMGVQILEALPQGLTPAGRSVH